jgi:hypothetical protein
MDTDTYIVMRGAKFLGYIDAYSSFHAIARAEKFYGKNIIIERVTKKTDIQSGQKDD